MSGRKLRKPTIQPNPIGRRSYSWDLWCDGSWYEIRLGEDVAATTAEGFRTTLQLQATKRNLAFEMRSDGTRVQFCFRPSDTPNRRPGKKAPKARSRA